MRTLGPHAVRLERLADERPRLRLVVDPGAQLGGERLLHSDGDLLDEGQQRRHVVRAGVAAAQQRDHLAQRGGPLRKGNQSIGRSLPHLAGIHLRRLPQQGAQPVQRPLRQQVRHTTGCGAPDRERRTGGQDGPDASGGDERGVPMPAVVLVPIAVVHDPADHEPRHPVVRGAGGDACRLHLDGQHVVPGGQVITHPFADDQHVARRDESEVHLGEAVRMPRLPSRRVRDALATAVQNVRFRRGPGEDRHRPVLRRREQLCPGNALVEEDELLQVIGGPFQVHRHPAERTPGLGGAAALPGMADVDHAVDGNDDVADPYVVLRIARRRHASRDARQDDAAQTGKAAQHIGAGRRGIAGVVLGHHGQHDPVRPGGIRTGHVTHSVLAGIHRNPSGDRITDERAHGSGFHRERCNDSDGHVGPWILLAGWDGGFPSGRRRRHLRRPRLRGDTEMRLRNPLPLWTFSTSMRDPNPEEIKIMLRRLRVISIAKRRHTVQKADARGVSRVSSRLLGTCAVAGEVDLLAMNHAPAKERICDTKVTFRAA